MADVIPNSIGNLQCIVSKSIREDPALHPTTCGLGSSAG